jgi:RNA polymerase-binding transcription factor DksA
MAVKSKKNVKAKAAKVKKSKPAKKPVPKKSAPKKPAAKKPVKKPAAKPVKKAVVKVVKKAPAPKAKVAKKAAPKKVAAKKAPAPAKQPAVIKRPGGVVIRTGPSIAPRNFGKSPLMALRGAPIKMKFEKAKPLTKKEVAFHRDLLLKLRDRVIDEISFLANDNLNKSAKDASGDLSSYSFHMADQGTDNFDREFAASLLNSEHDVLYEIEEALRRIDAGTYGVCEQSGEPIERERLRALPFARFAVAVQAELERGKPKFRPFRRTSIQGAEGAL